MTSPSCSDFSFAKGTPSHIVPGIWKTSSEFPADHKSIHERSDAAIQNTPLSSPEAAHLSPKALDSDPAGFMTQPPPYTPRGDGHTETEDEEISEPESFARLMFWLGFGTLSFHSPYCND